MTDKKFAKNLGMAIISEFKHYEKNKGKTEIKDVEKLYADAVYVITHLVHYL